MVCGVNFTGLQNEHTTKEYDLSVNMAKELCMIENNPMGKLARQYFIY